MIQCLTNFSEIAGGKFLNEFSKVIAEKYEFLACKNEWRTIDLFITSSRIFYVVDGKVDQIRNKNESVFENLFKMSSNGRLSGEQGNGNVSDTRSSTTFRQKCRETLYK